MTGQGILQIVVYALLLVALGYPLGLYMARVYTDELSQRAVGSASSALPSAASTACSASTRSATRTGRAMRRPWSSSAWSSPSCSTLIRLQGHLFLNPDDLEGVPSHISLNTAASFVTNTNWQYYGGEYTMSYLSQMAGLAVQNFVSAAVGHGRAGRGHPRARAALAPTGSATSGSTSTARSSTCCCRSSLVVARDPHLAGRRRRPSRGTPPRRRSKGAQQTIARGPVASQIAIKQLGTNGGGFYNSNSAVPFENPNGLTNFLEMLAILLIPAAQVFMFGRMVLARRHAWTVFAAMFVVFAIGVGVNLPAEQHGSQVLRNSGVEHHPGQRPERREHVRQGGPLRIANTAIWATATTRRLERLGQRRPRRLTPAGGAVRSSTSSSAR